MVRPSQQFILTYITHDLGNYISGISGLANILANSINSYQAKQNSLGIKLDNNLQEVSEIANMLSTYVGEAFHYIEDMLDTTQAESEKFTLGKIEDCDLKQLIDRLLIFNKGLINDHHLTITTDIENNLPKLPCDILG